MAFFKTTRDQLKANAFVSNLEHAKAKFNPINLGQTFLHVRWAHEAMEKVKQANAGYIFSRQGWLYAAELCRELFEALSRVDQHRVAHTCWFMYQWVLWNEDQIGEGGMLSSLRTTLSSMGKTPPAEVERSPEPVYTEYVEPVEDDPEMLIQAALDNQAVEFGLTDRKLTKLPDSLRKLTNLQVLWVYDNQLTCLPEWLGNLIKLRSIYARDNQLTSLPESIGQLSELEDLELSGNRLKTLPESVRMLTSLRSLDLSNNQLERLPIGLRELPCLTHLVLDNNPALGLPPELFGPSELLDHYFRANPPEDESDQPF